VNTEAKPETSLATEIDSLRPAGSPESAPPPPQKSSLRRSLAVLLGLGVPILSFQAFQYDGLLHVALRFPNWFLGFFIGPLPNWMLGAIIALFPVFLATVSIFSVSSAFRLWYGWRETRHHLFFLSGTINRRERMGRWILFLGILVPVLSVVFVLRASGSYFYDGLVPFWIQKNIDPRLLKKSLPWVLQLIFMLAIATSYIFSKTTESPAAIEQQSIRKKIAKLAWITNVILAIATYYFVLKFGRREL
jgi:hypothetical protein